MSFDKAFDLIFTISIIAGFCWFLYLRSKQIEDDEVESSKRKFFGENEDDR